MTDANTLKLSKFWLVLALVCITLVPVQADQLFIKSFGCYKDGTWQAHCKAVIILPALTGPSSLNVAITEYVDGNSWNTHTFSDVTYTWAFTAVDTFSLVGLSPGDHQIYAVISLQVSSGFPPIQSSLSGQTPLATISVG